MWGLPGPGLEPVSPALAGGFLTTVPPGKPHHGSFIKISRIYGGVQTVEFGENHVLEGQAVT